MRRRSKVSSKMTKGRSRKAKAPNAVRHSSSSAFGQETEVARLTRERDEALEQQRATAEVLKIISASPTELQPVLEVVVRSAARYCEADDVTLFDLDGQDLREAAHCGAAPHLEGFRFRCTRGSVAGRTVLDQKPVHVIDLQAEVEDFPEGSALARRFGHRTIAGVPLLREGVAVGTLQLRRTEVNPFTDKQIALLGIFAAQPVIAIENARLLSELRDRTTELSESLEQQTATAGILQIISSSPTNIQPVFDAIVRSVVSLCDGLYSSVVLFDGELMHFGAHHNYTPEVHQAVQQMYPMRPDRTQLVGRAILTREVAHVEDVLADPEYPHELARAGGWRSMLAVPMLREGNPIGAICVMRGQPGPFSETHIKLFRTFADQAVIAIGNVRLF